LDAAARERYHGHWRQLRAANAPLRVVDTDGLRSAPITFFDQQLLSFANASWQKPARIIGETMKEWVGHPMEQPYFQFVPRWRMCQAALVPGRMTRRLVGIAVSQSVTSQLVGCQTAMPPHPAGSASGQPCGLTARALRGGDPVIDKMSVDVTVGGVEKPHLDYKVSLAAGARRLS
jgi:hypothetical protein